MRKIFLIFLFIFCVFQFGCAESNLSALDEKEWDFGRVKQGVIASHDFIFENFTSQVLKITSIHTSCGCTVSDAPKKTLLPGEKTAINVRFNSKGYNGEVKQFVYVNTDNPDLEVVKFVIKANVIKN